MHLMGYEFLPIEHSFALLWIYRLVQPLLYPLVNTKRRQKTMELILAICVTGLGLFGSMFFIWKGHHP